MSHPEQMGHVVMVRRSHPEYFTNANVLEVGSRNVNGSVRVFFEDCDYVGLDCVAGEMVDVVCLAHDYKTMKRFDTVVSCEAFEHDPHYKKTIRNMVRLLKPGGLFVATWASPARPEHGTNKTYNGDGLFGPDPDYYRGVSAKEFLAVVGRRLDPVDVRTSRKGLDVYAVGFKPG